MIQTITAIGPNGEVANAKLIEHSKHFEKRIIEITEGVYQVMGVGLANTTMIEGKNGMIIVDTGDGMEEAAEHLEAFRKITDKPVSAIIYTHWHYTLGTRVYVPEGQEDTVEIWSHELVDFNRSSNRAELLLTNTKKALTQFAMFLPSEGPDSCPNLGIGSYFIDRKKGRTTGYVKPNRTVSKATKTVIDGINVELIPSVSDTNDGLIIWLPEKGVAINNVMWGIFPNIGALRGDSFRDPRKWIESIRDIRSLHPTHIIGVHGLPISGVKESAKAIEDYHDGMQFVYDQTVRGINLGLSGDELVEFVKLPRHLESNPILQPFYGEVANAVRGIYSGLIGWYGNDTATIHPVSKKVEAEKIITGFGGMDNVIEQAQEAYEEQEYAWAAQLITYVLKLAPTHKIARQVKAMVLRKLAQATPSTITRNFYLTQALELEDKLNPTISGVTSGVLVSTFNPEAYMHFLRVKVDPLKSEHVSQVMRIAFTDATDVFGLHVRKGLAEVVNFHTSSMSPDIILHSTCKSFAQLLTGECTLEDTLQTGSIIIEKGTNAQVTQFFSIFDHVVIHY
ncbi:alkyl sulfatase dimerization domain-containing protein [Brevibacillus sp. 179-C9.3 HS]|uniref:alkyl sulfatase dimerization domain-containing protein n=1 Tax=unclassified Brevibacillus TaxID=2684853 RepID=UPI00399F6285